MPQVIDLRQGLSREEALQRGLGQVVSGMAGLGQAMTRQEALQMEKEKDAENKRLGNIQTASQLRSQGFDVTPEQVEQYRSGAAKADIFSQRTPEYLLKQKDIEDERKLRGLRISEALGPFEKTREAEKMKFAAGLKSPKGGKELNPSEIRKLSEGAAIPTMLQDISATIEARKEDFGPIEGMLRSLNPYDVEAKSTQAQMKAASQAFGRYMEGGVLRKEDEEKYREMFPNLSDTPQVAKNKLAIVDRLLKQKQATDIDALKQSGYDVSGLPGVGEIPGVPRALTAERGSLAEDTVNAAIPKAMASPVEHPQANEALMWAQQNPQDPRAQAILQKLGVK